MYSQISFASFDLNSNIKRSYSSIMNLEFDVAKNILESAYLEKVFLNNNHNTHVIIPNGIIVIKELTILKIKAVLPSRTLCV